MNKVKILVVEDDGIIAAGICNTLEDLGYETLEPAVDYTEAVEFIEEEMPDIAILDIQLSGRKTGIDLAKKIRKDYDFPFIFLTSNADAHTVGKAKEVMPPAYLVKPFTKEELYTSIEIALHNYARKGGELDTEDLVIKDALFIKNKSLFTKIRFEDISHVKSAHVYAEVYHKNGKMHVVRESLNKITNKLNQQFIRVHRSYIVNVDFLEQIENETLIVNGLQIPIGETYKKDLMKKISYC